MNEANYEATMCVVLLVEKQVRAAEQITANPFVEQLIQAFHPRPNQYLNMAFGTLTMRTIYAASGASVLNQPS